MIRKYVKSNKALKRHHPEPEKFSFDKNYKQPLDEVDDEKLFIMDENHRLRLVSKKTIEDTDLLVDIHNALVFFFHNLDTE